MPKDNPRLAILGAGPIGLEAGAYARGLKLPFTIFERARIAEYWQRWGHIRLFSPFGMNATALGKTTIKNHKPAAAFPDDDRCLTGREHSASYLVPLAEALGPAVQGDTQVIQVGRQGLLKEDLPNDARRGKQPFRLLLRDSKGRERIELADVVLDCTGSYGHHRWMGEGGVPALGEAAAEPNIAYGLEDILGERKHLYLNKTTLVVGAGYSAATTVSQIAQLATEGNLTWAYWIARSDRSQPIPRVANDPLKERDRLAVRANTLACRTDDNIEYHPQTIVDAIEFLGPDRGFRVTVRTQGKPKTWEVDRIVANVGYSPDRQIYRELQVHECYATFGPMNLATALSGSDADCLKQSSHGPDALRSPEPNFFILGSKSYGRNSRFLLQTGFAQVREAFTLITGKADLNLNAPGSGERH
jgi:thioredoxin reductase